MIRKVETLERARKISDYIIEHRATVREAAEVFGISKSTVHRDVTVTVRYVDWKLYLEVKKILSYNISQRAIRGGETTRRKYKK